ncbi:MAG: crossover junction endodeoxyribonuclease RuvC [Lentisphaerales bacterium]|nr:MAG: crossover junction endodeoxyribonuclease RuvC [Lentisphaerales bacterium]
MGSPKKDRVLGVDTSLRSSGVAVVEAVGSSITAIEYGLIKTAAKHPVSECLGRLHEGITDIIKRLKPGSAAIEGGFYCKNVRTALVLGEARGAVIAACAALDVPVFEYSPRRVKQALVGYGAADKRQVRGMVMKILNLTAEPQEDEGDALAIAVCHLHNVSRYQALAPHEL